MNLFTRYKLFLLKNSLKERNLSREGWGNQLKITNTHIVKRGVIRIKFERQLISYLISYYKEVLHLDFYYEEEENFNLIQVVSPFVNLSLSAYFHSADTLSAKTNQILTDFSNTSKCGLNSLKRDNPNIDHFEIKCADVHASNFFKHKKEFYLLDIEDFYFLMYNKENQLIHVTELDENSQKHVIKYKDRVKLKTSRKIEQKSEIEDYKYILI